MFRNVLRDVSVAMEAERSAARTNDALRLVREAPPTRRQFLATAAASALGVAWTSAPAHTRAALDVGIVGAGLAGLSCAFELARGGVEATVYEASSRVGGRCSSLRGFFPGQVAELGGEFIDNLHETMLGYARSFGVAREDVTKAPGEVTYFTARPWTFVSGNGSSYSDLAHHQATWETNVSLARDDHAVLTDYSSGARGAGLNPAQTQQEARRWISAR